MLSPSVKATYLEIFQFLGNLGKTVSFNEDADHPAIFSKMVPYCKTHHKCAFFAFSGNFIIRFSGNEFSQDCSPHYFVKSHVWEKIQLLSYGSRSYLAIRLHYFSEYSLALTTSLFRMIIIDITSVLKVVPVVLEIEKETWKCIICLVLLVPSLMALFY